MSTRKPFSSISYNSPNFLSNILDTLLEEGKISFWAYITHEPEEDEEKSHHHVYVEPAKPIEYSTFVKYFIEPVESNMPLRCLPCRPAKTEDWILYNLHDKYYLASKFQSRKYHYKLDDFVTSDIDYLRELFRLIDRRKFCGNAIIMEAVEHGLAFSDLVSQGYIPIQQIRAYRDFYDCLVETTNRGGRFNHEPTDYNASLKEHKHTLFWERSDFDNMPSLTYKQKSFDDYAPITPKSRKNADN